MTTTEPLAPGGSPGPPDAAQASAQALAEVRAYCGWHLAPSEDSTAVLDGSGASVLLLPSLHVTAVAQVVELGLLLDPQTYEWSASGVIRRMTTVYLGTGARWTNRYRAVEVTFTHGFPEMPLDVQPVLDRLTARAVGGVGLLTQVGQVSYATGEDGLPVTGTLTTTDREILDRYKLPHRA